MTTSTATTEFNAREALRQFFEVNALTAFNNCIELLKQRDFYLHALSKIEQGADLTMELPELKLVKKTTAKSVCKQLAKNAEKKAVEAPVTPINMYPSEPLLADPYMVVTVTSALFPVLQVTVGPLAPINTKFGTFIDALMFAAVIE